MIDQKVRDAVRAIGRSEIKLKIFLAVYYHKQRVKSVDEIAIATGYSREKVLQAGIELKKSGLFEQEKKDGRTAYRQIEYYQNNKDLIERFVRDPTKMEKLQKKEPAPALSYGPISFVKQRIQKNERLQPSPRKNVAAKLRIAFLTTNPVRESSLRTDIEVREVQKAIQKSINRDAVDVRHIPAAQVADLLEALNEFRPQVVHFAGHGGDSAVLFDHRDADDDGGVEVNFELVNEIVSATATPPTLLVFNACDTLDGAEAFLKTVSAVVAMSSSIGDAAATIFSQQFYSALASGQSVADALKQGKVMLKALRMPDADLPNLLVKPKTSGGSIKFF